MLTFFKDTLRDTVGRATFRKAERRHAKETARTAQERRQAREEAKVRDRVWRRDRGVCRAYGVPLKRLTTNPYEFGHCAHLEARSQGGPYTTGNLALLSPMAHERHHLRFDGIGLEMTGEADGILTFREFNLETGETLRQWEN